MSSTSERLRLEVDTLRRAKTTRALRRYAEDEEIKRCRRVEDVTRRQLRREEDAFRRQQRREEDEIEQEHSLVRARLFASDLVYNMYRRYRSSGSNENPITWLHHRLYEETFRDYTTPNRRYNWDEDLELLLVLCGGGTKTGRQRLEKVLAGALELFPAFNLESILDGAEVQAPKIVSDGTRWSVRFEHGRPRRQRTRHGGPNESSTG